MSNPSDSSSQYEQRVFTFHAKTSRQVDVGQGKVGLQSFGIADECDGPLEFSEVGVASENLAQALEHRPRTRVAILVESGPEPQNLLTLAHSPHHRILGFPRVGYFSEQARKSFMPADLGPTPHRNRETRQNGTVRRNTGACDSAYCISSRLESVVGRQNHDAADEVGHLVGHPESACDGHMQWITTGGSRPDQERRQPTKHVDARFTHAVAGEVIGTRVRNLYERE